jgi:hypothetical protein
LAAGDHRGSVCHLLDDDLMARYPCSGCGDMHCPGQCFLECEADYTEDEPTTSTLTIADLLAKYGSQLTQERIEEKPLGDGWNRWAA